EPRSAGASVSPFDSVVEPSTTCQSEGIPEIVALGESPLSPLAAITVRATCASSLDEKLVARWQLVAWPSAVADTVIVRAALVPVPSLFDTVRVSATPSPLPYAALFRSEPRSAGASVSPFDSVVEPSTTCQSEGIPEIV